MTVDGCDRCRSHDGAASPRQRDLESQAIARHDLLAKLGIIDTAQRDARHRQQERHHLGKGFNHQHARHERRARKVALEEFLVDRDVLDRDDTPTGIVLRDVVN